MQRRSFLSVLFAPLLRRFLPANLPRELPVQHAPLMGVGKLVPFKFDAILNDDLSALVTIPPRLGAAAREHWRRKIATLIDTGEINAQITFKPMRRS